MRGGTLLSDIEFRNELSLQLNKQVALFVEIREPEVSSHLVLFIITTSRRAGWYYQLPVERSMLIRETIPMQVDRILYEMRFWLPEKPVGELAGTVSQGI